MLSYQRQFSTIGPVENTFIFIELQINGLRQMIHDDLDIISMRWIFGSFQSSAEDPTFRCFGRPFLSPEKLCRARSISQMSRAAIVGREVPYLPIFCRHCDTDTPVRFVFGFYTEVTSLYQDLEIASVGIAAHDTVTFTVTPVHFILCLDAYQLLWSMRLAARDHCLDVATVELGAEDAAVVLGW